MKKMVLIPVLLTATLAFAQSSFEVTPLLGYHFSDKDSNLKNSMLFGGEVQYNGFSSVLKPELSFFYASPAVKHASNIDTTKISGNLNGVYEFNKISSLIPLMKAGLGLSTMTNSVNDTRDNSANLNLGAGVKIPFTDMLALKTEFIYKPTYNDSEIYHNVVILAGLNFNFGTTSQITDTTNYDIDNDGVIDSLDRCVTTKQGAEVDEEGCEIKTQKPIVSLDSDNDGVIDLEDLCANTLVNTKVDANGCKVEIDSDQDGIVDAQDSCVNTPLNTEVDIHGCKINKDSDNDGVLDAEDSCIDTPLNTKVDVRGCKVDYVTMLKDIVIRFGYKYTKLTPESDLNIEKLLNILKENPSLNINILGYTDSIASKGYNQKLSLKRAEKIQNMLIERGISQERLHAIGMGEVNPIATNMYKAGRAKNRRIEIEVANLNNK